MDEGEVKSTRMRTSLFSLWSPGKREGRRKEGGSGVNVHSTFSVTMPKLNGVNILTLTTHVQLKKSKYLLPNENEGMGGRVWMSTNATKASIKLELNQMSGFLFQHFSG